MPQALLISHEGSNPSTLARYSVADSQANLGGVNTIYTVAVDSAQKVPCPLHHHPC